MLATLALVGWLGLYRVNMDQYNTAMNLYLPSGVNSPSVGYFQLNEMAILKY